MEPHLYLKRGKKNILLVRYFDQLHFITLDHRMHYRVRDWFLAAPRTVAEMNQKQLSRSTIDLKDIRGVAVGGTGRGQVVQFYLKEGKRRYELDEDCDEETLSALFHGLESFTPPQSQSNWQDPRLAKQDPNLRGKLWLLGGIMNTAGLLSGWFVIAAGFYVPWVAWICLLCLVGGLALYCLFPDYFTLFRGKRRYGQRKSVMDLYLAVALGPLCMIGGAMGHAAILGWWKAWAIGTVVVIALAVLLWKCVKEFRSPDRVAAFVLLGAMLSAGPVLAVNFLLDFGPAQEIRTECVDTDHTDLSRGGDSYHIDVMLDGEERSIPVTASIYEQTQPGDRVTVKLYEGALGIPYAKIE